MATKPNALPRWQISLITATPAEQLGFVYAADKKAAIKAAIEKFDVAEPLRDRVVARRVEGRRPG
jgi:hypothetical protein